MKFRVSDDPKSGIMSTFDNILLAAGCRCGLGCGLSSNSFQVVWADGAGRGGYHLELQTKFANISQSQRRP